MTDTIGIDMAPPRTSVSATLLGGSFLLLSLVVSNHPCDATAGPIPTCDDVAFDYFPNDCIRECQILGEEFDTDRSRDVNGLTKCYCSETPICNDDPLCEDLLVIPGAAQVGCAALCPNATDVSVVDDVQFSDDPSAGNKNQTHFRVSCVCDGVTQCGTDFVLFSDLSYLPSCTGGVEGTTLDINSEEECAAYCTEYGFSGSAFESASCECSNGDGTAVACDDARANDDRGEFTDCFDQVGVSTADCPTPSPTQVPAADGATRTDAAAAVVASWFVVMLLSSVAF
jgi:hypothetical protein